jgi:hypothetical protein
MLATIVDNEGGNLDDLPEELLPSYLRDPVAYANGMESPRVIKTHMRFEHLPQNILDVSKGEIRQF